MPAQALGSFKGVFLDTIAGVQASRIRRGRIRRLAHPPPPPLSSRTRPTAAKRIIPMPRCGARSVPAPAPYAIAGGCNEAAMAKAWPCTCAVCGVRSPRSRTGTLAVAGGCGRRRPPASHAPGTAAPLLPLSLRLQAKAPGLARAGEVDPSVPAPPSVADGGRQVSNLALYRSVRPDL